MNKFLAALFLLVAGIALQLANFWYTFGIWPKSWWSFVLCALGSVLLMALHLASREE